MKVTANEGLCLASYQVGDIETKDAISGAERKLGLPPQRPQPASVTCDRRKKHAVTTTEHPEGLSARAYFQLPPTGNTAFSMRRSKIISNKLEKLKQVPNNERRINQYMYVNY